MIVIRILGMANGLITPLDGLYVVSCDVDAHEGRGELATTADPTRAKAFAVAQDGWAYWMRQSKVRPLRPDGKPNRPLTAYTVEIGEPR